MTLEELRKLDQTKLTEALKTSKELAFKHHFEVKNGQSKNSHLIKKHKRESAKIKTIIREKENTQPSIA